MQVGDLVKVNKRSISALWHKVGIVVRQTSSKSDMLGEKLAYVLLDGRERLLGERDLDVIHASR